MRMRIVEYNGGILANDDEVVVLFMFAWPPGFVYELQWIAGPTDNNAIANG